MGTKNRTREDVGVEGRIKEFWVGWCCLGRSFGLCWCWLWEVLGCVGVGFGGFLLVEGENML